MSTTISTTSDFDNADLFIPDKSIAGSNAISFESMLLTGDITLDDEKKVTSNRFIFARTIAENVPVLLFAKCKKQANDKQSPCETHDVKG
jgi:hypothetical protein